MDLLSIYVKLFFRNVSKAKAAHPIDDEFLKELIHEIIQDPQIGNVE